MAFVATLRHDAVTAHWVNDGPVNGEIFKTCVEQVLVPTLHKDDNLASGK